MEEIDWSRIEESRQGYRRFIDKCRISSGSPTAFRLTPGADESPYALCFAIFGLHLLQESRLLSEIAEPAADALRQAVRASRRAHRSPPNGKPYRQLLAFVLSALAVVDALATDPLEDLVVEQLPDDAEHDLRRMEALAGRAQSGNQAMFLAIFLLHARDYLNRQTQERIDRWTDLHLAHMNGRGFWGRGGMTHLQFQNGYHQHEVLEYLEVDNPYQRESVSAVASLADREGRFAPYPGGGGCYDYDAVFMLTPEGHLPNDRTAALLRRTAASIMGEQRPDGGFAESCSVRPRTPGNLLGFARHISAAGLRPALFKERLRYGLTLQRPYHNRIRTHWSEYSRRWDEADLWDSWFRMLTLARIDVALRPDHAGRWGFIDYPGIGFHPCMRAGWRAA